MHLRELNAKILQVPDHLFQSCLGHEGNANNAAQTNSVSRSNPSADDAGADDADDATSDADGRGLVEPPSTLRDVAQRLTTLCELLDAVKSPLADAYAHVAMGYLLDKINRAWWWW